MLGLRVVEEVRDLLQLVRREADGVEEEGPNVDLRCWGGDNWSGRGDIVPRGIGYLLLCQVLLIILDVGFNLLLLVLLLILIAISILLLAGVACFFFHLYVFGRVVLRNLWREVYRCPIWCWFRCVVVDELINCHRWLIVFFWTGVVSIFRVFLI